MRIGRVELDSECCWAELTDDGAIPIPADSVVGLVDWLDAGADARGALPRVTSLSSRPPLSPGKIIGVGLNYRDHVLEVGAAVPPNPLLFTKPTSSAIGPNAEIRIDPRVTSFADWEVELAVAVGRRMRNVAAEDAWQYVLGYMVANDVTARDIQEADGQWFRAKSIDTFCPLGPWLVTRDEVPDPQDLVVRTTLNGQIVQESNTSEMIFPVAELLAFCSRHFLLEPGDVILTGTPPGVGMALDPPRALRAGDIVAVEVEKVGVLSNPVVEIQAV